MGNTISSGPDNSSAEKKEVLCIGAEDHMLESRFGKLAPGKLFVNPVKEYLSQRIRQAKEKNRLCL